VQQRVLSVPELTERLGYTYCFERFAEGLDPEVYQAKGFVRFADETYLFNYVNGRWELEPVLEAETGLVFIGRGIRAKEPQIVGLLKACEV
jgi:hypothetical protein